jgi:rhodanese-related sulfurtransferase
MRGSASIFISISILMGLMVQGPAHCADPGKSHQPGEFEKIYEMTAMKNGAKEIDYNQFVKLRESGEKIVFVDVLSPDDYRTGHIEGAVSMPCGKITKETAVSGIAAGFNVIVYCLSSRCRLSGEAACKLSSYGYKVLVYKGGLDEWQQKGNKLVR